MAASHDPNAMDIKPWYKQFWPWFLISILLSSVAFGTLYAIFSIKYYDGVIEQDYYEHGKEINMVLAKQTRARELGLAGDLRVDPLTSDIVVDLEGERRPDVLDLKLIFPTENDHDQTFTLEHVREGRYIAQGPDNLQYRWYLQLQPVADDPEWRLVGEARFPTEDSIELHPGGRAEKPAERPES
ncbi:FixH family protein [Halomonas piscis]|uniref:FixH family protein n=1 Tax=Halomonas piscis TaxID=3031727 RepID=A0ABY9YYT5_9GAMM|nr:FixH family protein [Halomonas piscis]WNK19640.1 FixH family protein [Halomonas piscis]